MFYSIAIINALLKAEVSLSGGMLAGSVTAALRDLYTAMDRGSGSSIPPFILLQVLHAAFPRFAEKSSHGGFQQQVRLLELLIDNVWVNFIFAFMI